VKIIVSSYEKRITDKTEIVMGNGRISAGRMGKIGGLVGWQKYFWDVERNIPRHGWPGPGNLFVLDVEEHGTQPKEVGGKPVGVAMIDI